MLEYPIKYYFARSASYFFSWQAIFIWILLEHFYLRKNHWHRALLFLILLMPWNTLLKNIIAVPLMPPMSGFAIPSGHSHAALAFWGYLILCYWGCFTARLLSLLLVIFFWSLVHLHYHHWLDVIIANVIFLAELALYVKLHRNYLLFALLATICMIPVFLILGEFPSYLVIMISGFVLAKDTSWQHLSCLLIIWLMSYKSIVFNLGPCLFALTIFLLIKLTRGDNASSCNYRLQ